MTWDPSEPTFAATARTIFTRRVECARESYQTGRNKAVNELSAYGLARSGAMLKRGEELGAQAIQAFADGIVGELHALVTDSVGGHPVPLEAIQWIRDEIERVLRPAEADSSAVVNRNSEESAAPSAVVDLSNRLRRTEEELQALKARQQPRAERIHGPNFILALRGRPTGKVDILRVGGDAEAHHFGQRVYGLLIQSEWKAQPPKDLDKLTPAWGLLSAQVSQSLPADMRIDEHQPQGLLLMVSSPRTEPIEAMICAMQQAGLGCSIGEDRTLPADTVQIVIGSLPTR